MRVIEIGNCIGNGGTGMIIEASHDELAQILDNLLYQDVKVTIDREAGVSEKEERKVLLDKLAKAESERDALIRQLNESTIAIERLNNELMEERAR